MRTLWSDLSMTCKLLPLIWGAAELELSLKERIQIIEAAEPSQAGQMATKLGIG